MTLDPGDIIRRRPGDRRHRPRFEIVGDLSGTLETVLCLPLRNVGLNGALLEAHMPLAVNSVHRVSWDGGGGDTAAQVRVRHVRRVSEADGSETYLMGVEFVSPSPLVQEQLQKWILQTAVSGDAHGA